MTWRAHLTEEERAVVGAAENIRKRLNGEIEECSRCIRLIRNRAVARAARQRAKGEK